MVQDTSCCTHDRGFHCLLKSSLSSVALQFVIYVFNSIQPCSASPTFIPPTIEGDTCIAVPPGETFHTDKGK